MRLFSSLATTILGCASLAAQALSSPQILLITDTAGVPSAVAPGGISQLFLTGVPGYQVSQPLPFHAAGLPLPTTLAGVSVALSQYSNAPSVPVPLLDATFYGNGGAILTIQVPYGLSFSAGVGPVDHGYSNQLIVTANGVTGPSRAFQLEQDRIRVVSGPYRCSPYASGDYNVANNCGIRVYHADGRVVLAGLDNLSAKPDEILVLYALGLGEVSPIVAAGSAAPNPPAVAAHFPSLSFNFTANAPPSPYSSSSSIQDTPIFAGLVPGYTGLYQVNFRAPTPPPGTPNCFAPGGSASNVTVTLRGYETWDGVAFCVESPPAPQPQGEPGRK